MSEPHQTRLKRLRMRSSRRGTKEMDLILGAFAERWLDTMNEDRLRQYDALLQENDQDLYAWVTGQAPAPARFADLIGEIAKTRHD